MRKLVTIRKIDNIKPIPNADAIEVAVLGGWEVVVKKNEFQVGDSVLYFEIDSILPEGVPEFDYLTSKGSKDLPTEDGSTLRGYRLRTIKLRGQVSQGLVIPLTEKFGPVIGEYITVRLGDLVGENDEGAFVQKSLDDDFSDVFGVKKYEKPIPASLAGQVRGNYPGWLPKTDQERIQNLFGKIPEGPYQIEEKLEGSSMTIYWDGESVGVTSRNVDLKLEQEGNSYVDMAKETGLLDILQTYDTPIAIRGELIGNGVQGNIYKMTKRQFRVFDVYTEGRYLNPKERDIALGLLQDAGAIFHTVPVLGTVDFVSGMENYLIDMADGKSALAETLREGLVFKGNGFSFKSVSKKYLEKEKD